MGRSEGPNRCSSPTTDHTRALGCRVMREGSITAWIESWMAALNAGDHEGVLAMLTDDVEWKRVDGLPDEGGMLRGKAAVREFLEPEVFDRARVETLEVVEGDDIALVHLRFHA